MTYVFGDIHGCLDSFETLLGEISPEKNDTVITLGDYVDRGPNSRGVIERLLALENECELICLRGNHEMMMVEAQQGPPASGFWIMNGGTETLDSYRARSLRDIPETHWEFFDSLKSLHVTDTMLLTHATPRPQIEIENFNDNDLFWNRFPVKQPRHDGRLLICGHTPQPDCLPRLLEGHLCIDTGAPRGGFLTAFSLENGHYLQADEAGEMRSGEVEGFADWQSL